MENNSLFCGKCYDMISDKKEITTQPTYFETISELSKASILPTKR